MKKMTQKQIAAELNVSPSTVSIVLNNPQSPKVSESKREAILAMSGAHGLKRQQVKRHGIHTIAILLGIKGELPSYASRLLAGIHEEAFLRDVQVVTDFNEDSWLARLERGEAQSGIVATLEEGMSLDRLAKDDVCFLNVHDAKAHHRVIAQEREGVCRAIEYFFEMGHRKILFISDREQPHAIGHHRERLMGFMEALYHAGHSFDSSQVWNTYGLSEEERHQDLKDFMSKGYTAAMVYNDFLALKIQQDLLVLRASLPKDMSLIGFDNSPFCEQLSPRLSSIDVDYERMGAEAVHLLFQNSVEDKATEQSSVFHPRTRLCQTRLSCRDSVANLN